MHFMIHFSTAGSNCDVGDVDYHELIQVENEKTTPRTPVCKYFFLHIIFSVSQINLNCLLHV